MKRVRIQPRIGPGTGSQPLSSCGSEGITKQAGMGDWNPGKGAVRPRQVRPLEAAGATARPLPPALEGAGAWSQRRGPCCRPLPSNRHFWPACLASSAIYIPGVLAVILNDLAWMSSGVWNDPTFIFRALRIPAQRRGAMSPTHVS